MSLSFDAVNYLAVVVAGVVMFLLGGAWYTALFGKIWVNLHGYSETRLQQMKAKRPPALFFTGMIICYLLISLALGVVIATFAIDGLLGGLLLGLIAWVIVAGFRFTGWLATDNHLGIFLIDAAFDLVALLVAGGLLGAWQ